MAQFDVHRSPGRRRREVPLVVVIQSAWFDNLPTRIVVPLLSVTAVAARVGARAEAERYFTARGSRTTPARAKALLMRLGTPGERRDDDALDAPDDPAEV